MCVCVSVSVWARCVPCVWEFFSSLGAIAIIITDRVSYVTTAGVKYCNTHCETLPSEPIFEKGMQQSTFQ